MRLGSEYYIFINFNVKYYLSYHVGVVEVRKNCLDLAIATRRESAYFSFNKSFKKSKKSKKQNSPDQEASLTTAIKCRLFAKSNKKEYFAEK